MDPCLDEGGWGRGAKPGSAETMREREIKFQSCAESIVGAGRLMPKPLKQRKKKTRRSRGRRGASLADLRSLPVKHAEEMQKNKDADRHAEQPQHEIAGH